MNPLRTIPALLYLLMMVVLPHAHLVTHGHACETEHPVDHEQPAHDTCALCHLLTLPAHISKTEVAVIAVFRSVEALSTTPQACESLPIPPQQARDPPVTTA